MSWRKRIICIYRSVSHFFCYLKSMTTRVKIYVSNQASFLSSKFIYPIFYCTFLLGHFKFNMSVMEFLNFFPRSTVPKFFPISININSILGAQITNLEVNLDPHSFHLPLFIPSKLTLCTKSADEWVLFLFDFHLGSTNERHSGELRESKVGVLFLSTALSLPYCCRMVVTLSWPSPYNYVLLVPATILSPTASFYN